MLYKLLLLATTLAAISSVNKANQRVQISINRRLLGTDEKDSSSSDDGYGNKNGYVNGDGNKGGRGYGWDKGNDKSKSNSRGYVRNKWNDNDKINGEWDGDNN
eukprot:294597_1